MKLTLSILLFSLIATPQGFNDRRIIVISSSEHNSEVKNQIKRLQKRQKDLEERKLAVYTLINGEVKSVLNPSNESEKFVNQNKSNYTAATSPKIYLIGLDKSVKQTFTNSVQPEQIFDIVDSMPMRQAEMRRN